MWQWGPEPAPTELPLEGRYNGRRLEINREGNGPFTYLVTDRPNQQPVPMPDSVTSIEQARAWVESNGIF